MNIDIEKDKIMFLLCDIDEQIERDISQVFNDSKEDPHYSAVFVSNRIKCYIEIMHELGELLPYNTVEGFFDFNAYTKEEYMTFEELRKKESAYYRGVQY